MPLTKLETQTLGKYLLFLDKPPTMKDLLLGSIKNWLILTVFVILGAAYCYWIGAPGAGYILLGMWIGCIARDYGIYRATLKIMPVFLQIIDRRKIEELLGQPGG